MPSRVIIEKCSTPLSAATGLEAQENAHART
jgi:hypothetical protein